MTRRFTQAAAALLVIGLGLYVAQAQPQTHPRTNLARPQHGNAQAIFSRIHNAVAVLRATEGNHVAGVVTFEQQPGNQVKVTVNITGLNPNSEHGFHIHQYGDLTSTDGSSAGGHYNPQHHEHALPPHEPRHAGDMGNIKADAQGEVHETIVIKDITLAGPVNPILGRGVVVHGKADNGSQPSGAAGPRLAVGVIGVAKDQGDQADSARSGSDTVPFTGDKNGQS